MMAVRPVPTDGCGTRPDRAQGDSGQAARQDQAGDRRAARGARQPSGQRDPLSARRRAAGGGLSGTELRSSAYRRRLGDYRPTRCAAGSDRGCRRSDRPSRHAGGSRQSPAARRARRPADHRHARMRALAEAQRSGLGAAADIRRSSGHIGGDHPHGVLAVCSARFLPGHNRALAGAPRRSHASRRWCWPRANRDAWVPATSCSSPWTTSPWWRMRRMQRWAHR